MEPLLFVLLAAILGVAMYIIAPILAWVAFLRSKKANKDREELHSELKALREELAGFKEALGALKQSGAPASAPGMEAAKPAPSAATLGERVFRTPEEAPSIEAAAKARERREEEDTERARELLISLAAEIEAQPAASVSPPAEAAGMTSTEGERAIAAQTAPEPFIAEVVEKTAVVETAKAEAPVPEAPETPPQAPTPASPAALGRGYIRKFLAALFPADRQEGDWETRIGRNWLNIIGIVVLIVGLVLLIQQTLLFLGAGGKIALGAGAAALLVAGGLYQERQQRYRIFARTLVGGGWALLYFTAYAAYNIETAKIIEDEGIALLVLLGTAAAIITHSFVYRSQFVTGLAYGLGFLALHLSPLSFYSLVAVAILAASIVFVIRFTDWRMLGLLTVVATYGTHARWLWETEVARQIGTTEIILSGLPPQAAFWANMGLLLLYWTVFCAAALVHPVTRKLDRLTDLAASALNMIGLLSLCAWQMAAHIPGNTHYLAAVAAVASAAIAVVDRVQQRPLLSLFNGSVAVVLYASALPLALKPEELSPDWLAPYWTVGAALVWIVGARSGRALYRYEAYAMALLALAAALMNNFAGRMTDKDPLLWLAALGTLVLFQTFTEILRKGREDPRLTEDDFFAIVAALGSAAIIGAASWSVVAQYEAGAVWGFIALLLLEIGGQRGRPLLRAQSYLMGLASFVAFARLNLWGDGPSDDLQAWSYALAGSGLFYLASARLFFAGWPLEKIEAAAASGPAALATILWAASMYQALPPATVCIAWIVWALALQQIGRMIGMKRIAEHGLFLGAAAFAVAVAVNVYQLGDPAPAGPVPNWVALAMATAGLYLLHVRTGGAEKSRLIEAAANSGAALHAATLLFALLIWREVPSVMVALAWAALGLALFELSVPTGSAILRQQSHLLMIAAFVRLFMANFVTPGEALGISHRVISVVPVIVTLYYLRGRVLELLPTAEPRPSKLFRIRERDFGVSLYSWAAAVLLVVLARFEVGSAYAVAVWSPIFVVFLTLGLAWDNRDFRFQSYLLAVLLFARSWSTNAYLEGTLFGMPERIVTALPVVVALLLAVIRTPRASEEPPAAAKRAAVRFLQFFDAHARPAFGLLLSLLVAILIFYQLSIDLVSIGWAGEALSLSALGFAIKERSLRITGLALLLVCLFKVTFLDLQGVETIYRVFSFIVLGVILLLISLGYSRYRRILDKYI